MANGAGAARQSAEQDDLAELLTKLAAAVADEASHNVRFRSRLSDVLNISCPQSALAATDGAVPVNRPPSVGASKPQVKRGRRAPGPWDPFTVYAELGEPGLRDRLNALELEQLRDIIAEHGMNHDGKAMRWKTADRVVGRIVERVVDRAAKGDAFRGA